MAKDMAQQGGPGAGTGAVIEPSIRNALLYFMSLAVFPLVVNAAVQGGWWIAAPMVFFMLPDWFDVMFGTEERNMDLAKTLDRQLFWYKLAVWLWAVLWPATLGSRSGRSWLRGTCPLWKGCSWRWCWAAWPNPPSSSATS